MMEDYLDNRINPHFVTLIHEYRKPEPDRDTKLIGEVHGTIGQTLARLESQLKDRDYLAGSFSLADIAYMPDVALIDRFRVPVDATFTNIAAWIERLRSRPSYAATSN